MSQPSEEACTNTTMPAACATTLSVSNFCGLMRVLSTISKGGQNILSNMQTLCETCNYVKANFMPEEAQARFSDPRFRRWMEERNRMIDIYGSIENKYKLRKLLEQMGIKNAWKLRQELRVTTSNPTT